MTSPASAHVPSGTGLRLGPLLPARLRPPDRPRLWVELAFTALNYWGLHPHP